MSIIIETQNLTKNLVILLQIMISTYRWKSRKLNVLSEKMGQENQR